MIKQLVAEGNLTLFATLPPEEFLPPVVDDSSSCGEDRLPLSSEKVPREKSLLVNSGIL